MTCKVATKMVRNIMRYLYSEGEEPIQICNRNCIIYFPISHASTYTVNTFKILPQPSQHLNDAFDIKTRCGKSYLFIEYVCIPLVKIINTDNVKRRNREVVETKS